MKDCPTIACPALPMVEPMSSRTSWLFNQPIAHRGLHDAGSGIPENSERAFRLAIEKSIPIEIDVRHTSDKEAIVFHDDSYVRMTGEDYLVKDLSLSDIRNFKLQNTEYRIPTLKEFLGLVSGQVPILIEIKNLGDVGVLESDILNILREYDGEFAIQSFNPFVIKWFKDNAPNVFRGQITGTLKKEILPIHKKIIWKIMALNIVTRPHFAAVEIDRLPALSSQFWRLCGVRQLAWTVRTRKDEQHARKYAKNIIFEGYIPDS
jgi:glycerophosphoryl diester phosphodiesterase